MFESHQIAQETDAETPRLSRKAIFVYAERLPSGSLAVAAFLANNTSIEFSYEDHDSDAQYKFENDYDEDWKLNKLVAEGKEREREEFRRQASEWSESDSALHSMYPMP